MTNGEKIRVLIVDDITETRENVRKLLQFESDVEVVGAARTGKEAIELSKEVLPDVLLMDINMPDMDGITATERVKRILPHAQIVILSVQNDPNYMRRAMMAGARDFLAKPPTVDELTAAIRRAGEVALSEKAMAIPSANASGGKRSGVTGSLGMNEGSVIMVYSPKGGTGATTVAINLAIALHNKETPVGVIDTNLQFGDIAVFLNEQVRYSILDLAPRVDEIDKELVEEVMITHAQTGVKILAAPTRPEYAENITADQVAKIIRFLRRRFSYIIVDTSSTLTDSVLAVLDETDLVILVITQEIPSIRSARIFLDLIDGLKIGRQRVILTMNRYDKRIAITPERVGENFKQEVLAVVPLDERVVVPSVNRGVPFIMKDKSRPVARSILSLAEVVRERISTIQAAEDLVVEKKVGK
jgi:pilus assembly protein CpaE